MLHAVLAGPHSAAVSQGVAYATGIAMSFVANRWWTLGASAPIPRQLSRFLAAHLCALNGSSLLIQAAISRLDLTPTLAWGLVVGPTTVVKFVVQHFWVFA